MASLLSGGTSRSAWRKTARSSSRASAWDGRPTSPEKSGWHWVEDSEGPRPLLWRGEDWPEPSDRGAWQDGYARLSAQDLRGEMYYGAVALPGELMTRFRELMLAGCL